MIENPNAPERQNTLFKLSGVDILLYVIFAIVSFVLYNGGRIVRFFSNEYTLNEIDRLELSDSSLSPAFTISEHPAVGTAVVILFWLFVGSVSYMVIWLTQNSLAEIKQEIDANHFVDGSGRAVSNPMRSVVAHYLTFIALIIIGVSWFLVLAGYIFPVLSRLFYISVVNLWPLSWELILILVGSVLGMAISLYILATLVRMGWRFWSLYLRAS